MIKLQHPITIYHDSFGPFSEPSRVVHVGVHEKVSRILNISNGQEMENLRRIMHMPGCWRWRQIMTIWTKHD